ncbi:hypothetical protein ACIBL3_38845 [Kribbella sp. NPDC050124]
MIATPLYLIHAHIGFIIFERLGDERPLAPRLKRVLSGRRQPALK